MGPGFPSDEPSVKTAIVFCGGFIASSATFGSRAAVKGQSSSQLDYLLQIDSLKANFIFLCS